MTAPDATALTERDRIILANARVMQKSSPSIEPGLLGDVLDIADRLASITPPPGALTREEIAQIIYNAFPFPGGYGQKPAWVKGGNSFMQDEARRTADDILSCLPARTPGTKEVCRLCNGQDFGIGWCSYSTNSEHKFPRGCPAAPPKGEDTHG